MSTSESSDKPPLAEKDDANNVEEMESNKVTSVVSNSKDDRSNREEKKVSDQQKIRRPRGFKVNRKIKSTFCRKVGLTL
jgi:RNase P subunit RPR2